MGCCILGALIIFSPLHDKCFLLGSPAPLPCSFNVANWKWYHDISLAIFTESSVYSNGRAFDMNIDSHRGGGWVGGGGAPAMSQFTALQLSCPTLWPPLALLIAA